MNLEYVKSNPDLFAKNASIKELETIISKAAELYYGEQEPIISDIVYDILIEELENRDNTNPALKIGFKGKADKVKLPYFMGSMNKIKTKDGINSWISKYASANDASDASDASDAPMFVISDKLDGISVLYSNNNLYTRGNGEYGRNINGLLSYLNLPSLDENVSVRGELIISKKNFDNNRGIYTSARSMVNGLAALKENVELCNILDFVLFEVIEPKLVPSKQFEYAKKIGFKIPNITITSYENIISWKADNDNYLTRLLNSHKSNSKYDIDGIILSHNKIYERTIGNPKNSIAFKSNNYGKITTIKDIEWNVSKYGILIPRIKFEKIDLGSIVEYCTGFSGKYIFNNSLGPGSKIRVILSGDVIPYIIEIITRTYPKMPCLSYKWDINKLHCKLIHNDSELDKKRLLHFIKTINIDFLSVGIINKLYENGFKNINDILQLSNSDLLKLDGFKETLATKIITSIQVITSKPIYLGLLMSASLEFNSGFGIKRFKKILDTYPSIMDQKITLEQIIMIDGFHIKTAQQFIDNLDSFKLFLKDINLNYYVLDETSTLSKNPKINQKYFVITGFRDAKFIDYIESNGGIIQSDVSMKTNYVIVKDSSSNSNKVKKANIIGIKIMTKDNFISKI